MTISKWHYVPDLDFSTDVMGIDGQLDSVKNEYKQNIKIESKVYKSVVKSYTHAQRFCHRGKIILYIPDLKKDLHISFGGAGDWAWFESTRNRNKLK